jgi:NAD dependent epimerase/dehydratase family enzyme
VRSREKARANAVYWNPEKGEIDGGALDKLDACVHLAGENIAKGRWTQKIRQRIKDSRVKGTAILSETLAATNSPPRTSQPGGATGYYGSRATT